MHDPCSPSFFPSHPQFDRDFLEFNVNIHDLEIQLQVGPSSSLLEWPVHCCSWPASQHTNALCCSLYQLMTGSHMGVSPEH